MPVMVPLVIEDQLSPAEKAISSSFALIVSVGGKPDGGLAKRTGLSLVNVAGARMECQYYILLLQIITTTTTTTQTPSGGDARKGES